MRTKLLTAILLIATTGCGGNWLGLGGSSAPQLRGAADADLIAYSEAVHDRLAAVEDCADLHALALGVAASVRSVLGDELARPSQPFPGEPLCVRLRGDTWCRTHHSQGEKDHTTDDHDHRSGGAEPQWRHAR